MPIPFVVEPDVFQPSGGDRLGWIASHERLLKTWGKFGVLVLPTKQGEIAAVIGKLPPDLRMQWQKALQSTFFRKKICADLDSREVFETIEKLVALKNEVNVACLEDTRASCLGIEDDMLSRMIEDGNFEICRLESVDRTRFFREETELWDTMIYAGTKRNDIWEKRFYPLAVYTKNIAVIDRYCLLHHEEHFFQGGAGVKFFLKKLSQIKSFSISVFTSEASNRGLDVKRATENLKRTVSAIAFPPGTSLHLHVVPDRVFGRVAHDRFVRFDTVITSIGSGLRIFEEEICGLNFYCGLLWDVQREFRQEIEGKLSGSSSRSRLL
jgi:hypothetical protein